MNDTVWINKDMHYQSLSVFDDNKFKISANDSKDTYSVPIKDYFDTQYTIPSNGKVVSKTVKYPYNSIRTASRCSQASTSTVFLNHWDSFMYMSTGILPSENNWVCGVPQNKLTKTSDGWEKTYENLTAGTYSFKVQEGTSWSYNFGAEGYNGGNCTLTVDESSDVKIIFNYDGNVTQNLSNTDYEITAEITPVSDPAVASKSETCLTFKFSGGLKTLTRVFLYSMNFIL